MFWHGEKLDHQRNRNTYATVEKCMHNTCVAHYEEMRQEQKCTSKFMPAHYVRHESFAAEVRKEGRNLDRCMLYYCTGSARLGVAHGLSATQKLLVICLGRMY